MDCRGREESLTPRPSPDGEGSQKSQNIRDIPIFSPSFPPLHQERGPGGEAFSPPYTLITNKTRSTAARGYRAKHGSTIRFEYQRDEEYRAPRVPRAARERGASEIASMHPVPDGCSSSLHGGGGGMQGAQGGAEPPAAPCRGRGPRRPTVPTKNPSLRAQPPTSPPPPLAVGVGREGPPCSVDPSSSSSGRSVA